MVNIHLRMVPSLGSAIVNRAEAEARRLQRTAIEREPRRALRAPPRRCLRGDAGGSGHQGQAQAPRGGVPRQHGVAKRGWTEVRADEVCKIPGVGPVAPQVAKEIAQDAFLSGVFYDGTDLRHFKRWTRNTPVEVRIALELGEPPDFDGVKCVDCGNRFRNENDHDLEPHCGGGPASTDNFKWRCHTCHQAKTERDRKAGKLEPRAKRAPP